MTLKRDSVRNSAVILLIGLIWNIPVILGMLYVQRSIVPELALLELGLFSVLVAYSVTTDSFGKSYMLLAYLSGLIFISFIVSGLYTLSIFYIPPLLISLRFFISLRKRWDFSIASISFLLLVVLMLISTSLRFIPVTYSGSPHSGFIFSIYDNSSAGGIPFTYAFGIVFALRNVALTMSPLLAFFFPLVSYLTAENTILIIRKFRARDASSLSFPVLTVLACQCENTIGIISGTVSSFALSVLPLLIFVSTGLLLITNIYLRRPRRISIPRFHKLSILVVFIIFILLEFLIVYTGSIYALSMFGLYSFLNLISGFLLGFYIPIRKRIPLLLIAAAFAIQLLLFYPHLIKLALISPLFFELYSIAGLATGIVFSLSLKNRDRLSSIGIMEFIFSMETMVTAAFIYLTLFSVSLFSGFVGADVLTFSVLILALSLPVMWFSNIYLINFRTFPA